MSVTWGSSTSIESMSLPSRRPTLIWSWALLVETPLNAEPGLVLIVAECGQTNKRDSILYNKYCSFRKKKLHWKLIFSSFCSLAKYWSFFFFKFEDNNDPEYDYNFTVQTTCAILTFLVITIRKNDESTNIM